MYITSNNAPPTNTYFAPPRGGGLGDLQPIDAGTILAQMFTPAHFALSAGVVIAGIVALHFIGGNSRPRKKRQKREPSYVKKSNAVLASMMGVALVGGIAYAVGQKTA